MSPYTQQPQNPPASQMVIIEGPGGVTLSYPKNIEPVLIGIAVYFGLKLVK